MENVDYNTDSGVLLWHPHLGDVFLGASILVFPRTDVFPVIPTRGVHDLGG